MKMRSYPVSDEWKEFTASEPFVAVSSVGGVCFWRYVCSRERFMVLSSTIRIRGLGVVSVVESVGEAGDVSVVGGDGGRFGFGSGLLLPDVSEDKLSLRIRVRSGNVVEGSCNGIVLSRRKVERILSRHFPSLFGPHGLRIISTLIARDSHSFFNISCPAD